MTKEEAVELLQTCTYFGRSAWEFEEAKEMAIKALTADDKPVVRGEWISVPHKRARICSHCECDEPYKFAENDVDVYNFCPNCGMPMTEEALKILARRDGERRG